MFLHVGKYVLICLCLMCSDVLREWRRTAHSKKRPRALMNAHGPPAAMSSGAAVFARTFCTRRGRLAMIVAASFESSW